MRLRLRYLRHLNTTFKAIIALCSVQNELHIRCNTDPYILWSDLIMQFNKYKHYEAVRDQCIGRDTFINCTTWGGRNCGAVYRKTVLRTKCFLNVTSYDDKRLIKMKTIQLDVCVLERGGVIIR
jgi:hypothetical protein